MPDAFTLRFLAAHPVDAGRVLETLEAESLAVLMRTVPADTAAQVLRHMTPDALAGCLRALGVDGASIARHLPVATAALALHNVDAGTRRALLAALPRTSSVPLRLALRYPRGTVGALLDPKAACVQQDMTVGETVQVARRAPEALRRYVYVLDERQRLVGVLDVRKCLLARRSATVESLMEPNPLFLRARASIADAVADAAWSRFDVLPVVDRSRTFLGVVERRLLDAAETGPESIDDQETGLVDAVIDLASLYWRASAAILLGQRAAGEERHER